MEHAKITKQQTQAAPCTGGTASQKAQSVTDSNLYSPISGLKNDGHEERGLIAITTPNAVGNTISAWQLNALSNTPPTGSNAQDTQEIAIPNQTVLKREESVIDIMKDNFIDLTQESDDESAVEFGPAVIFPPQEQSP